MALRHVDAVGPAQGVKIIVAADPSVDPEATPTPTEPTPTPTPTEPVDDVDNEVTVQLHWQNQYRETEGQFGGVDDDAAYHLDPEDAGLTTSIEILATPWWTSECRVAPARAAAGAHGRDRLHL